MKAKEQNLETGIPKLNEIPDFNEIPKLTANIIEDNRKRGQLKITEKEWSDIESSWERGFSCLC